MFAGEKYDTIYYATDAGSSEELSVGEGPGPRGP